MTNNTKKKILIIDDDEFSQVIYGDSLEDAGFLVVHASFKYHYRRT